MKGNKELGEKEVGEPKRKEVYAVNIAVIIIAAAAVLILQHLQHLHNASITGLAVSDFNSSSTGETDSAGGTGGSITKNITKEAAFSALLQAEQDMLEMMEAGLGVQWVNDTLLEARKAFEGENYAELLKQAALINDTGKRELARQLLLRAQKIVAEGQKADVNYSLVLEKAGAIAERKGQGFSVKDSLRVDELNIADAKGSGINTLRAEQLLAEAKGEFADERYEAAGSLLTDIDKSLAEAYAEATLVRTIYKAGRDTVLNFVRENVKPIAAAAVAAATLLLLFSNRIKVAMQRKKLQGMRLEQRVLTELVKKAQHDYYVKAAISKSTFDFKASNYRARLLELKRDMPVAEANLEKLLKGKRLV